MSKAVSKEWYKVQYKLQASVRDDIGRNIMFGEHMKDEQTC